MTLIDWAKRLEKITIDNSPAICTAIGVAGVITTGILSWNAALKIDGLLFEEECTEAYLRGVEPADLELPLKRKVEIAWPHLIAPVLSGTAAITCIIAANRIGNRRAAAIAAAYSLSEKAFAEYKDKVVEKVGAKKEQKVRDEVAKDRIDRNPVGRQEVVITGNGDVLCYDSLTGRYFQSNIESIRKAENDTNRQILTDNYASLSDFYGRIGLSTTPLSEELGWNLDTPLEVEFSTVISEDDKPCIVLNYRVSPIRGYYRLV